jgi:hypothetical protein
MSEFEMAYLQNDIMIALGSAVSYYFTMLTAFLVASYTVAHRLTRSMVAVVVSIFVLAATGSIVMIFRITQSLSGLAGEMRAFAAAGKGLKWHFVTQAPEWSLTMSRYVGTALFIAAAAGAVYFFFHSRRANRKAEVGAWHPKV